MKTRSTSASSRSHAARAGGVRRSKTLRVMRLRRRVRRASARPSKALTMQLGRSACITMDHEKIRRWAEARGGTPAVVKRTHRPSEPEGILRIDFPGFRGRGTLDHVSWHEWFRILDKHKLAFLYQQRKADGEHSTFNKLVRHSELL